MLFVGIGMVDQRPFETIQLPGIAWMILNSVIYIFEACVHITCFQLRTKKKYQSRSKLQMRSNIVFVEPLMNMIMVSWKAKKSILYWKKHIYTINYTKQLVILASCSFERFLWLVMEHQLSRDTLSDWFPMMECNWCGSFLDCVDHTKSNC